MSARRRLFLVLLCALVVWRPAGAGAQTGSPAVVLVAGFGSEATGQPAPLETFAHLRPYLRERGVDDAHLFAFSYAGGEWGPEGWRPRPYDGRHTTAPLAESAGALRRLIREVRARRPGAPVHVAGFSLGGVVALQAAVEALEHDDPAGVPDRVLAIAAPLQGLDRQAKERVCHTASAIPLAVGTAAVLAGAPPETLAAAGGLAASAQVLCPRGAVLDELGWLHAHPGWHAERDALLAAATRRGLRIGTLGSNTDCLYYTTLCDPVVGALDVDDRPSNLLAGAALQESYRLHQERWAWNVPDSHNKVLYAPAILESAADFLAGSATPAAEAVVDYSFAVGPLRQHVTRVPVAARAGQEVVIAFGIGNRNRDLEFRVLGPDGAAIIPTRRVAAFHSERFRAPSDGPFWLVFDNQLSLLSSKSVDLTVRVR